jgi:hypothetical protein
MSWKLSDFKKHKDYQQIPDIEGLYISISKQDILSDVSDIGKEKWVRYKYNTLRFQFTYTKPIFSNISVKVRIRQIDTNPGDPVRINVCILINGRTSRTKSGYEKHHNAGGTVYETQLDPLKDAGNFIHDMMAVLENLVMEVY